MKRTPAFPPRTMKQTTTLLPTMNYYTLIATTTGYAKYDYYFCFGFLHTPRISKNIPTAYFTLSQNVGERRSKESRRVCHRYREMNNVTAKNERREGNIAIK